MKYRIFLGLVLSCLAFAATAASTWQLNAGYYIPAKMPMKVVFPRPNSEITSTIARQQYAYADGTFQYRIPIAIQGGAYPFYVASTSGLPTGMTISSDPNSPGYMVAAWTPANGATGTYNCSVVVKDQEGHSVTVTWTVTIDNSKFIFIDPVNGSNTAGTGTESSPFKSLAPITTAAGVNNTKYAGKIVVFRAGTTVFTGPNTDAVGAQFYKMDSTTASPTNNPYIFLGYPGEAAIIDMSNGYFRNIGQSDVYFGQLDLENSHVGGTAQSGETDSLFYYDWTLSNRDTFFENTFGNIHYNSCSGCTNQAALAFWSTAPNFRQYLTIVGNTLKTSNVSLSDTFTVKYAVIDRNTLLSNDTNSNGDINLKDSTYYYSIRQNSSLNASGSLGLVRHLSQHGSDYIEICYNRYLVTGTGGALFSYMDAVGAPHLYVYRNTFVGTIKHFDNPGTYVQDDNVVVNTYGQYYGFVCGTASSTARCSTLTVQINGDVTGSPTDNLIDQNGNLIGSASNSLGRVGYQISNGAPLLSAPTWN